MNPNEKSVNRLVRGLIVDEHEDEKEVVEVVAVGGSKRRLLVFAKQLKSKTSRRRLDTSRWDLFDNLSLSHSETFNVKNKDPFKNILFNLIADIYISISTGTFDIENIKYEKKWQQLDLDTNFEP